MCYILPFLVDNFYNKCTGKISTANFPTSFCSISYNYSKLYSRRQNGGNELENRVICIKNCTKYLDWEHYKMMY